MKKTILLLLLIATPLAAQPPNTQGLRSSLDRVYNNNQAERGHQLYLNRCSRCHGLLTGGGGGGAPAFGGVNFNGDFEGYTLFDLENRIHTSMPRDQPGTTSRREATDLTAFILSQMKAPSGTTELPADDKALELFRIDVPPLAK